MTTITWAGSADMAVSHFSSNRGERSAVTTGPATAAGCPPGCICKQPWFDPDPFDPDAIFVELGRPAEIARLFRRPARCVRCRANLDCGATAELGWTALAGPDGKTRDRQRLALFVLCGKCLAARRPLPTQADLVQTGAIRDPHRIVVLRRPVPTSAAPSNNPTASAEAIAAQLARESGRLVNIHVAIAGAMHDQYHPWLLRGRFDLATSPRGIPFRCPCCPPQLDSLGQSHGCIDAAVIPPAVVAELGRAGLAYDDVMPAGRILKGAAPDRSAAAFFGVCRAHASDPSRYERALAVLLGRGDRASIVASELLRLVAGDGVPQLVPVKPARIAG